MEQLGVLSGPRPDIIEDYSQGKMTLSLCRTGFGLFIIST